ncbi:MULTISPECIES: hypothetical protein [unclassified Micromonospora]|uniref:hypothetical protein n=1 Tax=unclassified Micromonospora TaxID=2617518 RepID=UPI003A8789E9
MSGQAEADKIRAVRTSKADIEEKNLLPSQELEPGSLPRSYTQAVLRLYRREVVTLDRALGLLLGTFGADDLPELPPANEAEIWAFADEPSRKELFTELADRFTKLGGADLQIPDRAHQPRAIETS